jgi:3-oxoacyl-[acyl-carrier protein] reductase
VKVVAVVADVSDPKDAARVVKAAFDEFGRVDVLVNNSGGPPSGPFESFTSEMWDTAARLLLKSTVELTRAVLPGMKERRWGRILNVTSIAAKQPIEGLMLSNSLRAAVIGFARTLANEVAPFGVTVNNLLPGYTRTDRVQELARAAASKPGAASTDPVSKWEKEIPMGRLGEPREFAALAAFLASERASYITGSSIAVDGGWIRSIL